MKDDLSVDWSPDPADHAALLQRMVSVNLALGGPGGYQNIAVIMREPDTGEASSGIWGEILYGRLFIELLFVTESNRRRGLGSRLLTALEDAAHAQGCVGAWLNAYAFQAPGFFEKNGYESFGELANVAGRVDNRLCFYRKTFGR
jgi:GNAT superfamily N-acetyltransferase